MRDWHNYQLSKGILRRRSIGNCNENGHMLLEFCSEHSLTVTNTLFQWKERFEATWRHLWSKHWPFLNYILICRRDTQDVLHTRVMPSMDCYRDHRLVHSKITFIFKSPPRRNGSQTKKLHIDKFQIPELRNTFQIKLSERLAGRTNQSANPEDQWKQLKTHIKETTTVVASFQRKKNIRTGLMTLMQKFKGFLRKRCSCYRHILKSLIMMQGSHSDGKT